MLKNDFFILISSKGLPMEQNRPQPIKKIDDDLSSFLVRVLPVSIVF